VNCGKLRDTQSFIFYHNKSELAVEVVNKLSKCESQDVQTKIKNLKQTSIAKYFKKTVII
jgi:hypothetical protein